MKPTIAARIVFLLAGLTLSALAGCAAFDSGDDEFTNGGMESLLGERWRLIRIQSMDDSVYSPRGESEYSLRFEADGSAFVVADCNRGTGTWRFTPPSQLLFGPIALTKALCPDMALHERFIGGLGEVRSFVRRDDRLYLATRADGAILEFARR